MNNSGWFKAMRSEDAMELLEASPNAFILLYVIASRARRTAAFNQHNLLPGQAFVGDWDAYGMTRQEYRSAMHFLEKHNFAAFQPTTKGTIAGLINARVFDINLETDNHQNSQHPTIGQPSASHQTTTNKNGRRKKRKKGLDKTAPSRAQIVECFSKLGSDEPEMRADRFITYNDGRPPLRNWKAAAKGFNQAMNKTG